jgi:uncharacterized protein (TIGR00255 family)
MAYSMTGFGRGEAYHDECRITVEMKSVNNRYCDIQVRQPRILAALEGRVRELISSRLARGKIDIFINFEDNSANSISVKTDTALAQAYADAFRKISDVAAVPDGLTASVIGRFNDVLKVETAQVDENAVWQLLQEALQQALERMCQMRGSEGGKLVKDINIKLDGLADLKERIARRAPTVPEDYRQRLQQRDQELLDEQSRAFYDEQRLAAEVAIFADRCAIDEELVRLDSHFVQFRDMLTENEPIGKKLDFLIQEINREINTIGSKANDLELTGYVVSMKSELEKIREQIQNIE